MLETGWSPEPPRLPWPLPRQQVDRQGRGTQGSSTLELPPLQGSVWEAGGSGPRAPGLHCLSWLLRLSPVGPPAPGVLKGVRVGGITLLPPHPKYSKCLGPQQNCPSRWNGGCSSLGSGERGGGPRGVLLLLGDVRVSTKARVQRLGTTSSQFPGPRPPPGLWALRAACEPRVPTRASASWFPVTPLS